MKKLILPIIGGALLTLPALTLTACGGKATAAAARGPARRWSRRWPARPASRAAPTAAAPPRASTTPSTSRRRRRQRRRDRRQQHHPQHHSRRAGHDLRRQGRAQGNTDGKGTAARLTDPCGIAIIAAGDFYVSEAGPNRDPQDHARRAGHDPGRHTTSRAGPTARAWRRASAGLPASPATAQATSTSPIFKQRDPQNHAAGVVTTLAGEAGRWAASTAPVPRRASTAPAASLSTRPGTSTSSTRTQHDP